MRVAIRYPVICIFICVWASSRSKIPTYYFRHTFNMPSKEGLRVLSCRLIVDDGAIVYLNGIEVFRVNIPSGGVEFDTRASDLGDEDTQHTFEVNPDWIHVGSNVLAAEVHQVSGTSSDIRWQLEMKGTLALG